jgi:hypothetical protein
VLYTCRIVASALHHHHLLALGRSFYRHAAFVRAERPLWHAEEPDVAFDRGISEVEDLVVGAQAEATEVQAGYRGYHRPRPAGLDIQEEDLVSREI